MPGSWKHSTWVHILIGNAFVCLISDRAVGHWQDMKNRINGVLDILNDSEEKLFGHGMVSGPFEDASRNSRMWMGYINKNRALVKDGIASLEKSLYKGAEEVELITGDKKDRSGGNSWWYTQKNWKQNADKLRNWLGYLEEMNRKWDKPAPVQATHEIMTDFGNKSGANGNAKINDFLKRSSTGPIKVRTDPEKCNQTESQKEIQRQIQKSLAETFLYRNITLSEINQMTKIVDFVDRYRGRIHDFGHAKRNKSRMLPTWP